MLRKARMELDENRMDKRDDFSRKVGEKLREHQMPVAPDVWDALEKRLPKSEKRAPAYWPLAIAGVAAAFLALFFFLNPLGEEFKRESLHVQETSSPIKKEEQQMVISERSEMGDEADEDSKKHPQGRSFEGAAKRITPYETEPMETREGGAREVQEVEPKKIATLNQGVDFEKAVKAEGGVDPEEGVDPEMIVESREVDPKRGGVEPEEVAEPIEVDKPQTVVPSGDAESKKRVESKGSVETAPRSLLLALASGDGLSGFPFGNYHGDESYYYDFAPGEGSGIGSDGGGDGQYNLLSPDDYTDVEHRPPVSFSLMAGFPLNDQLNVEAGLSYTYLYSRFNRNDRLVYRGSLQQHYVGIPVNLRYRVWHNDDWQVYLSGGGSIEKGLRSIYKQEIEQSGDRVFETSVYNRINGFQFSAQGGAGFSYRVQNNLQLFAEPRLIYYFNNNQPMSARTEDPLVFGLNIGVRLQFQNK